MIPSPSTIRYERKAEIAPILSARLVAKYEIPGVEYSKSEVIADLKKVNTILAREARDRVLLHQDEPDSKKRQKTRERFAPKTMTSEQRFFTAQDLTKLKKA